MYLNNLVLFLVVFSGYVFSAPAGTITPCNEIGIRSKCPDLGCVVDQYFANTTVLNVTIPANGFTGRFTDFPNPNTSRVLRWEIRGLYGTYSNALTSSIRFLVNSYGTAGHALAAQIRYDFTGDGTWDKSEVYKTFSTNGNTNDYQAWNATGTAINIQFQNGTFSDLVGGRVELSIWNAFNSCCAGDMKVDRSPFITIPFIDVFQYPTSIVNQNATCAVAATQGTTRKLAFRLDGIQDYFVTDTQNAILSLFENLNIPLTATVITNNFGSDTTITNTIRFALLNPTWDFEVGVNGYSYEYWTLLDAASQISLMSASVNKLAGTLGIANSEITTFAPPYGDWDDNTVWALREANMTIFSGARWQYGTTTFAMQKSAYYRFPYHYSSYDWETYQNSGWIPLIDNAMNADGYAVIQIDPLDFVDTSYAPNTTKIGQLADLLAAVVAANITTTPIKRIPIDAPPKNTSAFVNNFNCSCVAFRLDDIQDFFVSNQQQAVINLFRELNAPLTVGVIAYYFGSDTANVNFVRNMIVNASASPCFKFEIANHGYYHEVFPNFTAAEQNTRMIASQDKIFNTLGVRPKTFIPPFNQFDANTITTAVNNGFTHFSSQVQLDPPPYNFVNPTLYRFPIGAATNNLTVNSYFTPVPWQFTWQQIQDQLSFYGYSTVMVHPYEFGNWNPDLQTYNSTVNQTTLDGLRNLLLAIQRRGLRIVLLGEIEKYFNASTPYNCSSYWNIPPFTTGQITTSPLTTSPLTTSPLTTSPLTTSPLTSSPLTSSPLTTSPLTTSPLTTSPLTTSPLTSSPLTSSPLTSSPLTTSPLTTGSISTGSVTTDTVSTAQVTSSQVTSSPAITSSPLTSSPITTGDITTSEEEATTSEPAESAENTSSVFVLSVVVFVFSLFA